VFTRSRGTPAAVRARYFAVKVRLDMDRGGGPLDSSSN
jgi:hypothetical protein